MRNQKVWSLTEFERLHIGGRCMNFYKQHCYMFHVTLTVKQIKRPITSSVKINPTHTSEAANQFFLLQKDPFLPNPKWASLLGHPASVVELADNLYVSEYVPYMLCRIKIRGGSGQSIHPIPFALSVLIDKTSTAWKGVSVHNHKVLVHRTSIRVTNASLI